MITPPQAVIIAGPNGSGKSTAATQLLPLDVTYLNADVIAQEMTGKPGTSADINAGRILLDKIDELERRGEDFAFETTLATKMLASRVAAWRRDGYKVHLVFCWLPSADLAVERVAGRVRDGGHDVPEETIRRRFIAGLRHFFHVYRDLVDTWRIYDNSTLEPQLIAGGADGEVKVQKQTLWNGLSEEYK